MKNNIKTAGLLSVVICLLAAAWVQAYNIGNPSKGHPHYTYKHVVFIGVDGMGHYHLNTDTPNIDRIFVKEGASTCSAHTVLPTISGENWTSITTGVRPFFHKVGNCNITARAYTMSDSYPTIFRLVRNAFPNDSIGSFVNWPCLNTGMVEQNLNVDMLAKTAATESELCSEAEKYIIEKKPRFMFIYFGNVDHCGDAVGYCSEEYYEAMRAMDGYVGRVFEAARTAGILEDTLFILTTDHGGVKGGGHGGTSVEEKEVFFGARGRTIIPGAAIEDMCTRDLPAAVCYALGIKGNDSWDSYLPRNMFADYPNPPAHKAKITPKPHKPLPTPDINASEGLAAFAPMEALRCGYSFDGDLRPFAGSTPAEFSGDLQYAPGWYGSAIRVNPKNFAFIPGLEFGTESFTVSMWMKAEDEGTGQPPIFSNKDWSTGLNKGFIYCSVGVPKFNVGDGAKLREDFMFWPKNETWTGWWQHVILSVDRENNCVTVWHDFEINQKFNMKAGFRELSFDTGYPFTLGRDGNGKTISYMSFLADDLMIFDKVFTDEDAKRLAEYYGMSSNK